MRKRLLRHRALARLLQQEAQRRRSARRMRARCELRAHPGPARSARPKRRVVLAPARRSAAAKRGNVCTHRQSLFDEPAFKEQPRGFGHHRLLRRRPRNCGGRARAARQAPTRAAGRADGSNTWKPRAGCATAAAATARAHALAQNMICRPPHGARLEEAGGALWREAPPGRRARAQARGRAARAQPPSGALRPVSISAPASAVLPRGVAGQRKRARDARLHLSAYSCCCGRCA